MNFFANQLRSELEKKRLAYENRLNLLTNASLEANNYLALETEKEQLEEQLNQSKADLQNTQQNIANLEAKIDSLKQNISELKAKLGQLQIKHKQERFALQKENRDYWFYHQREIKRLAPDLKAKIADLKKQKAYFLSSISHHEEQIANLKEQIDKWAKITNSLKTLAEKRKEDLDREKEALINLAKKKIQNKKEASRLLEQLQTSWTAEKQSILSEHQQEKEILKSNVSTLSFNLAFKESVITDLTARINALQTTLQQLLTEQEAQLISLDN